jgi:hypothetical protein
LKTRQEVEELKRQWRNDPCWDLWEQEGFEEYKNELRSYAEQKEAEWEAEEQMRKEARASKLGIPGNFALLWYIESLERRLTDIESRIEYVDDRVNSVTMRVKA